MKNQNEMILDYLKKGNSITPIDALTHFGCFRLGARIWDLRKQGHEIDMRFRRNGRKKFAEYWLKQKECVNTKSMQSF